MEFKRALDTLGGIDGLIEMVQKSEQEYEGPAILGARLATTLRGKLGKKGAMEAQNAFQGNSLRLQNHFLKERGLIGTDRRDEAGFIADACNTLDTALDYASERYQVPPNIRKRIQSK